jgi:hypothetical protein
MADIRQRIGLDYLKKRGADPESADTTQSRSPFMDDALLAHGRRILQAVSEVAPASAKLYDVIDRLQIPIDVALKVVDYLDRNGYLSVVARDLRGNHELRLTDEGVRLLQ